MQQGGEVEDEVDVINHFVPGDATVPEHAWLETAPQSFSGEVIVGRDLLEI
ncbi:hypothetical protein [Bradyrhizobium sp. CCBAU 51627]|uniref:hypothetical protein n=1 Tax=Bradyrhizobium sp. CCBAU 51627 TaxID=1325088 RepID=UPI00230507ED|nr:hypothetical protein [Bradyrhizobium sp. CCBAU 51627]